MTGIQYFSYGGARNMVRRPRVRTASRSKAAAHDGRGLRSMAIADQLLAMNSVRIDLRTTSAKTAATILRIAAT
jgi:hypothetical protein